MLCVSFVMFLNFVVKILLFPGLALVEKLLAV